VARDRPGLDLDLTGRITRIQLTQQQEGVVAELQFSPAIAGGRRVRGITPPNTIRDQAQLRERLRMLAITQ
ncbi:MAG TPA: hypothetical protein VFF69_03800, partial [Phycisphaerales bacterium]|nr:hypothetical protein [Phycisphaerales bacterium]